MAKLKREYHTGNRTIYVAPEFLSAWQGAAQAAEDEGVSLSQWVGEALRDRLNGVCDACGGRLVADAEQRNEERRDGR